MKAAVAFRSLGIALLLCACHDTTEIILPGARGSIEVTSDPEGAAIVLDGVPTGRVTTSIIGNLSGLHEVLLRLTRNNVVYGFRTQVEVKADSVQHVSAPLMMLCTSKNCPGQSYRTLNSMRISTNPNGALFYFDATEKGMFWPATSRDGYASIGLPLIATTVGARDTFALGVYDVGYLAGRPAPLVTQSAGDFSLSQSLWIVPPTDVISSFAPSLRGIEVEEELIATSATDDVAFIRMTFRNITNLPSYRDADPIVASGGVTYSGVFVGFGLDADIGNSDDDLVTYDPALDLVYMYDADFAENGFGSSARDRPALVGLRLLEAPAGAMVTVLNAWPFGSDWRAGEKNEHNGYGVLSGTNSFKPDAAGQHVGYAPVTPDDYRMSVSAGPLTLPPGGAASVTVAVLIAQPVAGTFTSGEFVHPENPLTSGRHIEQVAAELLTRARGLVAPD